MLGDSRKFVILMNRPVDLFNLKLWIGSDTGQKIPEILRLQRFTPTLRTVTDGFPNESDGR